MFLAGPVSLRLLFHGFVVLAGTLILAGAVNTSIIGSNGVLNRVAEDVEKECAADRREREAGDRGGPGGGEYREERPRALLREAEPAGEPRVGEDGSSRADHLQDDIVPEPPDNRLKTVLGKPATVPRRRRQQGPRIEGRPSARHAALQMDHAPSCGVCHGVGAAGGVELVEQ